MSYQQDCRNAQLVLIFLAIGGVLGIGGAFARSYIENSEEDSEERQKLEEVKDRLIPEQWYASA